jgi:hypothetical protein
MKTQTKVSLFPKAVKKHSAPVDASMLRVEHNRPLPTGVRLVKSKYDELFSQLKAGSCIVCESDEINRISNALRKYLSVRNKPLMVRAVTRCDDGHGRVWAVAKTK